MPLKPKEKEAKSAEIVVEQTKQKTEAQKKVNFLLCVFGLPQIDKVQVIPGTTLGQYMAARNLEGIEVRVNKTAVRGNYVIKEGDLVVVIPDSIEGGSGL
jgi:molybdopterin converting factor small subunit